MKKALLELLKSDPSTLNNFISGQVIFRDVGYSAKPLDGSDRKLMMIFGCIAVPLDYQYLGEHQYTINGFSDNLTLFKNSEIDQTQEIKGDTPSGILRKPIWRI